MSAPCEVIHGTLILINNLNNPLSQRQNGCFVQLKILLTAAVNWPPRVRTRRIPVMQTMSHLQKEMVDDERH